MKKKSKKISVREMKKILTDYIENSTPEQLRKDAEKHKTS